MQGWRSKKKGKASNSGDRYKKRRRLTYQERREVGAKADANQVEAKALWLLSSRDHSEGELRKKLAQRNYPQEHIDTVVARFISYGYIDDDRIAIRFARSLMRSGWGPMQIRAKMAKRVFAPDDIDDALHEIMDEQGDEVWVEYAIQRLTSKYRMPPHEIPYEERLKAKRHLAYRGYGGNVFGAVFSPPEDDS